MSQQRQQMAAARAAKDSEFVLQAEDIHINKIQKIGRPTVGRDILFGNFETHFGRIVVSLRAIGHGDNRTVQAGVLRGGCFAQVRCESGDSTLPGDVIRQKGDLLNVAWQIHRLNRRDVEQTRDVEQQEKTQDEPDDVQRLAFSEHADIIHYVRTGAGYESENKCGYHFDAALFDRDDDGDW